MFTLWSDGTGDGIGVEAGVGRVVAPIVDVPAVDVGRVVAPIVGVDPTTGDCFALWLTKDRTPVNTKASTSNAVAPIIVYRQARGSFCFSVLVAAFCSGEDEGSSCAGLCSMLCMAILPFAPIAGTCFYAFICFQMKYALHIWNEAEMGLNVG